MKRLLLVGGGLTHLEVLRRMVHAPFADTETVLVADQPRSVYAGMLPGVVAGHYEREAMTVNIRAVAVRAGVRFRQAGAVALDPVERVVTLEDGAQLRYDCLSINTGATAREAEGVCSDAVLAIKPAPQFLDALVEWESSHAGDGHVGVIGGGVAGVEMVFALAHRWRHAPRSLVLVERSGDRLDNVPRAARTQVRRHLDAAGIAIHEPHTAPDLHLAINAAGAAPPAWLANTGLTRDARGYLAVTPTLQTQSSQAVFASGDVATMLAHPRARAGVFAVRQGPVLFENLGLVLAGALPKPYRPQKHWLSLIATGGRHAIAVRNGIALSGRWAWWVKDLNDRQYLARYRKLSGKDV